MCNKFYATTLYKEFRIIRTPSRTYRLISDHDKNNITNSDPAIPCDLCASWLHIKCNDLNHIDYKFLKNANDPWLCIS